MFQWNNTPTKTKMGIMKKEELSISILVLTVLLVVSYSETVQEPQKSDSKLYQILTEDGMKELSIRIFLGDQKCPLKNPEIAEPELKQLIQPAVITLKPVCKELTCTGQCISDGRECFNLHKKMPYTDHKGPKPMMPFRSMKCCDGQTCCAHCDIMCTKAGGECYYLHEWDCDPEHKIMEGHGICDRCHDPNHPAHPRNPNHLQECCLVGKKFKQSPGSPRPPTI